MVEFALALPIVLVLVFGTIEMSRLLNIYVSLNRICQRAARELAAPDVTSSRPPTAGIESLRAQLRHPANKNQWHPGYSPTIHALLAADPSGSQVRIDVNAERAGKYCSLVEVQARMAPLVIPTGLIGGQDIGRITLVGRGLAINESQAVRQDAAGPYARLEAPLATVLQHPDEPLPSMTAGGRP